MYSLQLMTFKNKIAFLSRVDKLEDRARRDNLIFHGMSNEEETWDQTEEKIIGLLSSCIDNEITGI